MGMSPWLGRQELTRATAMMCPHCGQQNLPGSATCRNCDQDMTSFDRPMPDSRLEQSLVEDRVGMLSSGKPFITTPETSVGEAIRVMVENDVGALLVVDENEKLVGILSERDLLEKATGIVPDFRDLPVSQFMTPRPETVEAHSTLNYVLHKMDSGRYRHLPVVENGKPVNLVSIRDMLRYLMKLCRE